MKNSIIEKKAIKLHEEWSKSIKCLLKSAKEVGLGYKSVNVSILSDDIYKVIRAHIITIVDDLGFAVKAVSTDVIEHWRDTANKKFRDLNEYQKEWLRILARDFISDFEHSMIADSNL